MYISVYVLIHFNCLEIILSLMQPHRISVRSVTHSRRTSRDAACTMVIGKDVALGPTAVKASNVTATSAVISWLPSNSNHQHVVCVNNVEVRTVKPGVYRHTITGLAPSTIYRVTVKAKNLRATHFEDQNAQAANNLACHVHFKTLPKGLPDPPVDIQVNIDIIILHLYLNLTILKFSKIIQDKNSESNVKF